MKPACSKNMLAFIVLIMNMTAARYCFVDSVSAAPEGSRRGELAAISLKNLLQLERSRDVSTNGEQGKVDSRKRKLDAMNVDSDFREMVTNEIFFILDLLIFHMAHFYLFDINLLPGVETVLLKPTRIKNLK